MEIKKKIIQTLQHISPELKLIMPDFYIIGSAATLLSGLNIGNTGDIDIVTTFENSDRLRSLWSTYMEDIPVTKENDLFTSNFARYKFPLIDIEVMGELKVMKANGWQRLNIQEYTTIKVDDLPIRIPTIREQLRILQLFGREKDLKRIELINKLM